VVRLRLPERQVARNCAGLVMWVQDDGSGISAELLPRVFEPHFSTSSTGTGLSRAIVRRLVESWGGLVTIDRAPGLRSWPERGGDRAESQAS